MLTNKQDSDSWLEADKKERKKQRHTALRVFKRLKEIYRPDFYCSYRLVAAYVAEKKKASCSAAAKSGVFSCTSAVDRLRGDCLSSGCPGQASAANTAREGEEMEQWKESLAALVPHYDHDGCNATLIYTTGGQIEKDRRTVKWNLHRLARVFSIDLEASRRNQGVYLGYCQGVPLPFSPALVLVPLKTRKSIGRNDGCHAYVNCAAVQCCEEYTEGEARSLVVLTGGCRIPCFYNPGTVRKRLRDGKIVLERYRKEMFPRNAFSGKLPALLPSEYWPLLERLFLAVVKGISMEDKNA